jgi:hypothetical protein
VRSQAAVTSGRVVSIISLDQDYVSFEANIPDASACHGGQADDVIIAHGRDRFQCHAAARWTAHLSFCSRPGADQTDDRRLVGEDADHFGPALDLTIEALQWIGRSVRRSALSRHRARRSARPPPVPSAARRRRKSSPAAYRRIIDDRPQNRPPLRRHMKARGGWLRYRFATQGF